MFRAFAGLRHHQGMNDKSVAGFYMPTNVIDRNIYKGSEYNYRVQGKTKGVTIMKQRNA